MRTSGRNCSKKRLRTNDVAGDGTTTATVLAQAIVNEGLKNLAAGANPMQLKQGIDKGTEALVAYIRSEAIPVEGKKEIAQIASISAADETIGQLIAEVMDKVGKDGVITVEESRGTHFETESWSINCVVPSMCWPSRLLALGTAAKSCCATSPF